MGDSTLHSTPKRVEYQENHGFIQPLSGLKEGAVSLPPIAALHWGLFILKTFGLLSAAASLGVDLT
jgi:hypothetical protein